MDRHGFTLIELMIVVVIIGILSAMAVPRFTLASWRTKEKEAEIVLKQLYTVQSVYRAERGDFAGTVADLRTIGFDPPNMQHYEGVTDAHVISNACLSPLDASLSGKRIDFDTGRLSDC
jgi:prepilin-type N-terminal cleavage/methylation domain-containing protein